MIYFSDNYISVICEMKYLLVVSKAIPYITFIFLMLLTFLIKHNVLKPIILFPVIIVYGNVNDF